MKEKKLKRLEATDERQYMMNEQYEVYEKQGAPIGAMSFHYHNFYEILYVLEGEYSSMIENQTYHLHKGDFLLINKNVMHKYHFEEHKHDSSKRIILWVSEQMLNSLSGEDMDFTRCFRNNEKYAWHFPVYYEELLRGYLLKLAMLKLLDEENPGAKKVADRGFLTLFFVYLNMLCEKSEYGFQETLVDKHPLVAQVQDYVEAHLSENITVDDLADAIHISKYHFLRKFKELTGVTVHAFINHKRLIKACELLKEGYRITEVYQNTGFTDYSSFLRNFKAAYGVSPGKYLDFYPDVNKE